VALNTIHKQTNICLLSLSLTFHMLMISSITDEPLSWIQNLQEWCLWGSLQKLPSYILDLTNTWLPWAILVSDWFPCLYGLFYTGFLILTSYLVPSSIWIVFYWFPNINKLSQSIIASLQNVYMHKIICLFSFLLQKCFICSKYKLCQEMSFRDDVSSCIER
jgi:hypothetical protein